MLKLSVNSTHFLIQNCLMQEAKRIYKELYDLYLTKTIVNTPFYRLVNERIYLKYQHYEQTILFLVESLIPKNLYISFDHKYVFYDEQEYFQLMKQSYENKFLTSLSDKSALDQLAKQVTNNIVDQFDTTIYSLNIFDLLIPYLIPSNYNEQEYQYLINEIATQLEGHLSHDKLRD